MTNLPSTVASLYQRPWIRALLIAVVVWCVYMATGIGTSGDSRWSVPIALSLFHEADTDLDEYEILLEEWDHYGVEQVDGHYYSIFPVTTPIISAPFIGIVDLGLRLIGNVAPGTADRFADERADGERFGAIDVYWRVEQLVASFYVALAAALFFLLVRRDLPEPYALLATGIFAFATPAWSVASTALWQHGPSLLMLTITLALLVWAEDDDRLAQYAAIPLALAYTIRPTNSIVVVVLSLYVLARHHKTFWRFLLWSLPVAIPFIAYNLLIYGNVLAPYFLPDRLAQHAALGEALTGNMFSPSRGLLVYSPVFVFSFLGFLLAQKRKFHVPLIYFVGLCVALHWLVISMFPYWWGGTSYGPRFFTDMVPFLVFMIVPVLNWLRDRSGTTRVLAWGALTVCLLVSAFMHYTGASRIAAWHWHETPVRVDDAPERLWDWTDSPFLRPYRATTD